MTALLRSSDAGDVQAFSGIAPSARAAAHPLEAECAALRQALDRARTAAEHSRNEHQRALEAALKKGRQEGIAQAERREAERLAALEAGLQRVQAQFQARLEDTDRLGAELAAAALERLIDDASGPAALTAAFISRQVDALRSAAILRLHVSGADFPDAAALDALALRIGGRGPRITIACDANLKPGQARLDCALGEAEIDLAGQWRTIALLLRSLAND